MRATQITNIIKKRVRLLIILVFISLFIFETRDFNQAQESAINISNFHKVFSVFLVLFFCLIFMSFRSILSIKNRVVKLYFFYLLIGTISATLFSKWFGYSIFKIIELFGVLLTIIYILNLSKNNFSFIKFSYEFIITIYKFLIIVTIIGILIYPDMAILPPSQYKDAYFPYQLHGVIIVINPNSLGMIGAILFINSFLSLLEPKKNVYDFFWIFISTFIMLFSQSRTALFSLLTTFILFILFSRRSSRLFKFSIITALFSLILFYFDKIVQYVFRGYDYEYLSNLSGRIDMWDYAYSAFKASSAAEQAFGMGFATANRAILSESKSSEISTLHSDYFDILISSGYVGFLIIIIICFTVFYDIFKKRNYIRSNLFFSKVVVTFLLIFFRSFSGTSFAFNNFFCLMFLICILYISEIDTQNSNAIKKNL